MEWDRNNAVNYFMSRYEQYDPEKYRFRSNAKELSGVHDTELALQKLYIECAAAAEEKETLLAKLDDFIRHGSEDPRAFHPGEYRSMIQLEAAEIKSKIENGSLAF